MNRLTEAALASDPKTTAEWDLLTEAGWVEIPKPDGGAEDDKKLDFQSAYTAAIPEGTIGGSP
ncbi:MAG: hypothetical protein WCA15_20030 [Candidatus Acidiferrales bacterium]